MRRLLEQILRASCAETAHSQTRITGIAWATRVGRDIPPPGPRHGRPLVPLAPLVAIKVELYRAMRAAGVSVAQLAERMGVPVRQVENLLDTSHMSRLDQLAAAFWALGRRLVVTSEAA